MRKAIRSCYTHYNSGFLLEFSERLMKCLEQPGSVIIENNNDGTRSMKTADHKKLIVTFKAENQVNMLICDGEKIFIWNATLFLLTLFSLSFRIMTKMPMIVTVL